jgi:hypothetical protein
MKGGAWGNRETRWNNDVEGMMHENRGAGVEKDK